MKKHDTIQKQFVMIAVRSLDGPSTASEIYQHVVLSCPGISKGTIYRNLNVLTGAGYLEKVPSAGVARFKLNANNLMP